MVLSVPTFAQENSDNVIRVGSFEETYNTVNEKGERSGYGYEYLQDIAGYAGWTYKYITSDWKNCFTQLENGLSSLILRIALSSASLISGRLGFMAK